MPLEPAVRLDFADKGKYDDRKRFTQGYDIHATVLHLLGLDHEKLTFRHNGANRRLTDVHGHVIKEILS